jgi:NAD(P)-dependent dehydrogenase (short-subunit alcohol dehydrogenase family)
VNAAGVTHKSPTLDESEAEWSRVMDTNLTGTLRACQILARPWSRRAMGASSTSPR